MLAILVAVIVLLSGLFLYLKRQIVKNAPPVVKGSPLIGVLTKLDFEFAHLTLEKWSQEYGEIFQFQILGQTFVSLNSCGIIRDAFLREPVATLSASRPPTFFGKYALDNYHDIAFDQMSKILVKKRKLGHKLLNTYSEGLKIKQGQILSCTKVAVDKLKLNIDKDVDPAIITEEFLLDVVEILIVGKCSGKGGKLQKLIQELDDNFNTLSNPGFDMLYGVFPFLRFLPFNHSKRLKTFEDNKRDLMSLLLKISEKNPDLKGVYQSMMEVAEEQKKEENPWFNELNVRSALLNFLSAGFNTSRGTILSFVHILASRPELQKSLQKEINGVIGRDREPSLEDRVNCPRLEATVNETLRYISHVPLSVVHYTHEDFELRGYTISKGSTIIPNFWTAHHSKEDWEDPLEFKPERYLEDDGSIKPATDPVRSKNLAFGIGKRSCIGEVFARSRMFLFLATIIQNFTIMPPKAEPFKEFGLDDLRPGLVMIPKPYKVRFVKRESFSS